MIHLGRSWNDKQFWVWAFIVVAVAEFALAWRPTGNPDILNCLIPWMEEIKIDWVRIFYFESANYNPPYYYLLTLISWLPGSFLGWIGTFSVAFSVADMLLVLWCVLSDRRKWWAVITMLGISMLHYLCWHLGLRWRAEFVYANVLMLAAVIQLIVTIYLARDLITRVGKEMAEERIPRAPNRVTD